GVQADQTIVVATGHAAGPTDTQQQPVRSGQDQRVFDGTRRLDDQVLERRLFLHVDAGQVQHADAGTVGPPDGGAGATEYAGVVEEMLSPVQPYRLQVGQRGADGRGANGGLRQVHPDA